MTLEVSCFSHFFFFYQTTVGIYDTSQNGRSRTNTYLFLNCRMNINLHLHKCPEKASMCQVPGCKKIVKKKDMNVYLKEASTSHFALQSGEIKRLRGIIYYKVSCLFTNLKINKTCTLLNAKTSEVSGKKDGNCCIYLQNLTLKIFFWCIS